MHVSVAIFSHRRAAFRRVGLRTLGCASPGRALLDRLAARIQDTTMRKSTEQTIKRRESNDEVRHFS